MVYFTSIFSAVHLQGARQITLPSLPNRVTAGVLIKGLSLTCATASEARRRSAIAPREEADPSLPHLTASVAARRARS